MTDYGEQIDALRGRADELMARPDYWRNERLQREAARLWADVMVLENAAVDALPAEARTTADPQALRQRADDAEAHAGAMADDPHYDVNADMQAAVRAAYAEAVALQGRASDLEQAIAGDDGDDIDHEGA